jgi:glycosyltransferase involved in cell wall biosynthesis
VAVRVLALTKYGSKAASTRQRLTQFIPHLAKRGAEVEVLPLLSDVYLERLYSGYSTWPHALYGLTKRFSLLFQRTPFDLAWVNYEAFPLGGGLFESLLAKKIPYVLDLDDAFFLQQRNSLFPWERNRFARVVAHSSGVTAGNEFLAAAARPHQQRISIFPTVVDHRNFLPRNPKARGPLVLGWIGSPSTADYLLPLEPLLRDWCERGNRFLHIGSGKKFSTFVGEQRDWSEEREAADLSEIDIGIMPLPDSDWAKGKCAFKLIQYMMAGAAVVGSPVGMNREVVTPEVGFLAPSTEGWARALETFESKPSLSMEMGLAGKKRALALYSLDSIADPWCEFLLGSKGG